MDIFTPINRGAGNGFTLPVRVASMKWSQIAILAMTMTMLPLCMQSVLFLGLYTFPVAVLSVSVTQRAAAWMHLAVVAAHIDQEKYDRFNFKRAVYSLQCSNWSLAHCNGLEIKGRQGGGMGSFNPKRKNDMKKLDLNYIRIEMATLHVCQLRRLCRHHTSESWDWIATANRWQLGNALIWSV